MKKKSDPIGAVIGVILVSTMAFILFGQLWQAVLDGEAYQLAGPGLIGIAYAVAAWDRWWRCRRWPQPTELPPPRIVTQQHERVKDAQQETSIPGAGCDASRSTLPPRAGLC